MRAKTILVWLVAFLLVGAATVAAQTQGTGFIAGKVVDNDGTPLPGVLATLEGSAMMGSQTAYTSQDGTFRFALVPPGEDYTLTFSLQGFATVVRQNVSVGVRRTTTVNLTMRLAAVEETVTVTAETPLIDVKSTKGASEYNNELRKTLPEIRRQGFELMNLAPESSPPATGGATITQPSFFGSPSNSNLFQFDGANIGDPGWGGAFLAHSPDWFDVVELTSTGAGAEYGKAQGSVFNLVSKSGGNEFHGEFGVYGEFDALLADNTQSIESNVANFTVPELDHLYDVSLNLGGPVLEDKLWFFAGYQIWEESVREAGVQFNRKRDADRFFGKLTWGINDTDRLIVSAVGAAGTVNRPSAPLIEPEAQALQPSFTIVPNVTWNSVLSSNAMLEVKWSGLYAFFDLIPISDAPAALDLGTGVLSGAYWGHYTFDRNRTDIQGNLTYFAEEFAGDHAFKFGAEYERLDTLDRVAFGTNAAGEDFQYLPYFGQPFLRYSRDPDETTNTSQFDAVTVYAQDDWTIADRVTLNLGFRLDHWSMDFIDASREGLPTFNDLAPRLGVNFDLLGDGRVALHGFYGRFYEAAMGNMMDNFDPQQSALISQIYSGGEWVTFDVSDPLAGLGIDPDLTNTYHDQFTAGVDWQVLEHLSIGGKFIYKRDRDIIGGVDIGSTYEPLTVTNVDGETMTIYNQVDPFNSFNLLTNNPVIGDEMFRNFKGLQIKAVRRLRDNWSLIASLLVQKAEGNVSNTTGANTGTIGGFDNLNDFVNTPGELPNSRRFVFKGQGSYFFADPLELLTSFSIEWMSSARFNRTERFFGGFDDAGVFVDLGQSNVVVPIDPIGSNVIEDLFSFNMRLERRFPVGQLGFIGVMLDGINLTNEDTVVEIFQRVPNTNEATDIVAPRELRLGARWIF